MTARTGTEMILLVDDEDAITNDLASFLKRAGFDVTIAADGEAALRRAADVQPDLIVLDVLMPRLDGRAVLRRLRAEEIWTPVILLTQVGDATERAMALGEGADDYLNKPFNPHELVARIDAVLRRTRLGRAPISAAPRLRSGDLVLDRKVRRAWVRAQELTLTPKAFNVLEYLLLHFDELITRERLLDTVWGDSVVSSRALDTRIHELREALGDNPAGPRYIETVPGQGYRFVGVVEALE